MSSKLSKEALSLVEAGRSALRPSQGEKALVRHALEQQLAAQAVVPTANGSAIEGSSVKAASLKAGALKSGALKSGALWPKLVGIVAGLGASTVAVVLLWPTEQAAPLPAMNPLGNVSDAPLQPAAAVEVPSSASPPSQRAAVGLSGADTRSEATPAGSTLSRSDRLRDEVLLLKRAQKEFQAKRLTSALSLVDEHERKFPRGALVQERVTLRTRVLCAMGRVQEADLEQARLKRPQAGEEKTAAPKACSNTPR